MEKTFISGPVSGMDYEYVSGKFLEAENYLSSKGVNTVNPIRLCSMSWDTDKWERTCIKALVECDGIYMLKGWKNSKEAKLEHFIAMKLGMKITLEK